MGQGLSNIQYIVTKETQIARSPWVDISATVAFTATSEQNRTDIFYSTILPRSYQNTKQQQANKAAVPENIQKKNKN